MSLVKRTLVVLTVLVAPGGLFVNAKAEENSSPVYIDHQKVESSFKHTLPIPDLFAGQSGGGHYRVRASRHDTPTEVEIHTADTDIFYVTSGTATFVAGRTQRQIDRGCHHLSAAARGYDDRAAWHSGSRLIGLRERSQK